MNRPALQFEDAPGFSVGAQYFLATPLFVVAAGLLLAVLGGAVFASRFTPGALALTHLLTVGALAMCMAGALWQILPVVAGAVVPKQSTLALLVHRALLVGAPALATAFLSGRKFWFVIASCALVLGLGTLALGAAIALWRSTERNDSARGIRCAFASLGITLGLGLALAGHWLGWWSLDILTLVDLHAMWGLLGWIGILILSVGLQVIPMFQVTPPYPASFARFASPTTVCLLIAYSLFALAGTGFAISARVAGYALLALFFLFASASLWLLSRRKRPTPDIGTRYWRFAFVCLTAVCLLRVSGYGDDENWRDCLIGVMYLTGFVLSTVYGMLYRIVPFLAWYDLQTSAVSRAERLPSVRDMLHAPATCRQFRLHQVATLALALAPVWPSLARVAGILIAASALWMFALLLRVAKIHRHWRSGQVNSSAVLP